MRRHKIFHRNSQAKRYIFLLTSLKHLSENKKTIYVNTKKMKGENLERRKKSEKRGDKWELETELRWLGLRFQK